MTETAAEQQTTEAQEQPQVDVEERARKVGWRPLDEFRGDPSKHVDAETFLSRADQDMGLLKSNNEKLHSTVENLNKEIAGMKESFTEFSEFHKKTVEKARKDGYESARKDLLSQQRKAVEDGDTDTWDKLEGQKQALDEEYRKEPEPPTKPAQSQPGMDPEWSSWEKENTWYKGEAAELADFYGQRLRNEGSNLQGRAFFDEAARRVRQARPDLFENPNRHAAGAVDDGGGVPPGGARGKAKSYENLPADAKKKCDGWVAQGLLTKEEYVAEYDWED